MGLELTVLGCHSATPRKNAFPTAQYLSVDNRYGFLIDCGEGTQNRLIENNIRFNNIKQVFISHLHGDHFFGLVGLLNTMSIFSREKSLTVHAPIGIKEMVQAQLKYCGILGYDLCFNALSRWERQQIYEDEKITVHTIPLKHRVYTNGFLFREKRQRDIPPYLYELPLKKSKDFVSGNTGFVLTPPKSYAYCSDTAYFPQIIPLIKGVDLLYHEATFLQQHSDKAKNTLHSTARQAAEIAKKADVKVLLLGHYSNRYTDFTRFKTEAQQVFDSVKLAKSGLKILV